MPEKTGFEIGQVAQKDFSGLANLVRCRGRGYNARQGAVPKWLREQSAKLRFSGSNPLGASITDKPISGIFSIFYS